MKVRTVVIFILLLFPFLGMTQQASLLINEDFQNTSIVKIAKKLKRHYKIKFAYDHKLLENVTVSRKIENLPLTDALNVIFEGIDFRYKIIDNTVLIIPIVKTAAKKTNAKYAIKGIVMDGETGETLPFATLNLYGSGRGTVSNVDGFFTLLEIPSDLTTLVVSYLGYYKKVVKIETDKSSKFLRVKLSTRPETLKELVIEDDDSKMINTKGNISQLSLNPAKLLSLPSLGEVDIFRTLQYLPGISGTDETSAGLVIRGSSPDKNLTLFDGFSIYHIDHFFGVFSAFNPNAIKSIQIHKGAFESKFGGRTSGVIDITGKSGNAHKPSLDLGADLISAKAMVEFPLGDKASVLLAGRRSHTDVLQSGLYKDLFDQVIFENKKDVINNLNDLEFGEIKPSFNFYDINAKATYHPSANDVISLSLYNGNDKLNIGANRKDIGTDQDSLYLLKYNSNINDFTRWGNTGVATRWGRQWNKKFYSNINLAYSDYYNRQNLFDELRLTVEELDFDEIIYTNDIQQDNDLLDYTLRFDNEWKLNKNTEIKFGGLSTINEIDFTLIKDDSVLVDFSEAGHQLSLYFQTTFHPFQDLLMTLGIRNTHYDVTGRNYFEPRLALTYYMSDKFKLKAAWGKHDQFIFRIETDQYAENNTAFWVMANDKELSPIQSEHYVAGFSYETDNFLLDVEGYHKLSDGVIEFLPFLTNSDSDTPEFEPYFKGSNIAKGVDVLIQKKTGKHTGWLSYSYSKVENSIPLLNNGNPFPAKQDQRNEVKLVNMYTMGRWDLSATWMYGSGKPYSDPSISESLELYDSLDVSFIATKNINSERLPAYHRMDISATYNFKIGSGKAKLGLSIYNVYARKNVKYRRFSKFISEDNIIKPNSVNKEQPSYVASDILLFGFTPNVFFNIKF